jgi:diguanylate cyclase (GGDEF)-like protein
MAEPITEARMFAALSATNEAILRSQSKEELFQRVCDAAVHGAGFRAAAVLLPENDGFLRYVAHVAHDGHRGLGNLTLSIDEGSEHGRGLVGRAFRTGKSHVSNDVLNDSRLQPWHEISRRHGIGASAAVPIVHDRSAIGVLLFSVSEKGTLSEQIVALLERMAENISFGLKTFEREQHRERVSKMFAALSATNEAIIRARTREELCRLVCEAAVLGETFICTRIAVGEASSEFLSVVAAAGRGKDAAREVLIARHAARAEGFTASGIAVQSGQPYISNDYLNDPRMTRFRERLRKNGVRSVASFPFIKDGQSVGYLNFQSDQLGVFTPELTDLLQRLADNVAFALGNFDRAEQKKQADDRIQYLATHDNLTGLPNRGTFMELLEQSIKSARRHNSACAVLFIDLDRFKVINDSLGHAAGDALLIEVANRLRSSVRESDVVARLGGDEFVVILEDAVDRDHVAEVARKILETLMRPIVLGGHECRATGSIGIALFPDNGGDAQTLTKNADMAMYLAKEDGKNDFRFFSPEVRSQSIERLVLETSLRHALELNQFSLHYQPKLDIASGQINGVEALLRWTHPDLGQLPPMKFIPLAEETGLIVPIGRWVLRTACSQNVAWRRAGLPEIAIAVNLSPRQFSDENLLRDIDDILNDTGMSPKLLQLEITESMMMQNVQRAIKLLDQIQSRGIRLAIDDFGTGYSSMSMMKQFPIDTIKIDRSFVRDLEKNAEDRAIAMAIINMGKALGLTVVAEGVETSEQDEFLRTHACDELQGYLFCKPVPAAEIPDLLRPQINSPALQPSIVPSLSGFANPRKKRSSSAPSRMR